jgi:hypothetical protein
MTVTPIYGTPNNKKWMPVQGWCPLLDMSHSIIHTRKMLTTKDTEQLAMTPLYVSPLKPLMNLPELKKSIAGVFHHTVPHRTPFNL